MRSSSTPFRMIAMSVSVGRLYYPACRRRPAIGIPAGRVFRYEGRVTVYVGGSGRTAFEAPSREVHSFRGRASVRLGGEASYCFVDPNAEIRCLDDELLLLMG